MYFKRITLVTILFTLYPSFLQGDNIRLPIEENFLLERFKTLRKNQGLPIEERFLLEERLGKNNYWGIRISAGFISVPKLLQNLFVDGGRGILGESIEVGAIFIWNNHLELSFGIGWKDYSYDGEAIYMAKGNSIDPEFVKNSLSLLLFKSGIKNHHYLTSILSLYYGVGIGFGIVLGEIIRHEATPPDNYPYYDPNEKPTQGYVHCNPDHVGTIYCEDPNDPETKEFAFYGEKEKSVPPVVPWFEIIVGLSFKLHNKITLSFEGGFGIGFIFNSGFTIWL